MQVTPLAALVLGIPTFLPATAAGDTPPKGPPWHVEYRQARRQALRTGTPVFVYFTKTV